MFDIGLPELFVIALIALIVFGPERLPEMAAQFGKWVAAIRAQASTATAELKKSADIAGLSDIATDLKGVTPRGLLNNSGTASGTPEVKVVFDPDAT
jgi:sec-independent protein translocase protein TatB